MFHCVRWRSNVWLVYWFGRKAVHHYSFVCMCTIQFLLFFFRLNLSLSLSVSNHLNSQNHHDCSFIEHASVHWNSFFRSLDLVLLLFCWSFGFDLVQLIEFSLHLAHIYTYRCDRHHGIEPNKIDRMNSVWTRQKQKHLIDFHCNFHQHINSISHLCTVNIHSLVRSPQLLLSLFECTSVCFECHIH